MTVIITVQIISIPRRLSNGASGCVLLNLLQGQSQKSYSPGPVARKTVVLALHEINVENL